MKTFTKILEHEKNEMNIFETKFFSFTNLMWLHIKTITASAGNIFLIFLFPIMMLFGLGMLIPLHSILPSAFGMSIAIVTGILMAHLYFSFKNSTIGLNGKLIGISNRINLLSIFFVVFMFVMISMSVELVVAIIFETIGVFPQNLVFGSDDGFNNRDIIWSNMIFVNIYYFFIMDYIICFGIFGVARYLLRTKKTYEIFILIYFIMLLVFGGVLNPLFKTQIDGEIHSMSYMRSGIEKESTNPYLTVIGWTSIFMPSYYLNQQMFMSLWVGISHPEGFYGYIDSLPDGLISIKDLSGQIPDDISWDNYYFETSDGIWLRMDFVLKEWEDFIKTDFFINGNGQQDYNSIAFLYFLNSNIGIMPPNLSFFKFNDEWMWNLCVIAPFIYTSILIPATFISDR